ETFELAICREPVVEGKSQAASGFLGLGFHLGVLDLSEIDKLRIVPEIGVAQLRMAVDAETLKDQTVEMTHHGVGQEEAGRIALHQVFERARPGIDWEPVRPPDPLAPFLGEHAVKCARRAAVAIGDEDSLMPLAPGADLASDTIRYLLGSVVPARRQAGHLE